MRRFIVAPALSVGLFGLWVLLVQSLSIGNVLLGIGLALYLPIVPARLHIGGRSPRRPGLMAKLFLRVVIDMLRSNTHVVRALLTRRSNEIRSCFVRIPLELQDPGGLAVLAMIVTCTPGTAWAELSLDARVLLLHIFDTRNAELVVAEIKDRYERPLREIFE